MTATDDLPEHNGVSRYRAGGADITGCSFDEALALVIGDATNGKNGYACFVNSHVSVTAQRDKAVAAAVNESSYAFPDGMPVYLIGRYLRRMPIERTAGPDFMQAFFTHRDARSLRHYLYGGSPETLDKLVETLRARYPGVNIVGAQSPPFRPLTSEELDEAIDGICGSKADVVWVGLGAPKQELWMHDNYRRVPNAVFLGVGAAFDFLSGSMTRAPEVVRHIGLEWLHRLVKEPGRLWKRYLVTNSLFIYYVIKNALKLR